jgi:hypothetical protein
MDKENNQLSLKEKINKLDNDLDRFLADTYDNPKITEYLNYTGTEIRSLTPERCTEIKVELSVYNWHIQKAINKNEARLKWCEAELDKVLGQLSSDYGTSFWGERKLKIISDNSYAAKLYDYITIFKTRQCALAHHTLLIKNIADDISRVGFSKLNKV